jgi:hypothetical protein
LQNLALFCVKNGNICAKFFGENILKIITSVPGFTKWQFVEPQDGQVQPGANPTIASYNASVVKIYDATTTWRVLE